MFLSNLNIRGKVLVILATVSALTLGAAAISEFQVTRAALESAAFDKLTAVREMKAQQIEDYFGTINKQMLSFAENESVGNALQSFALAFKIIEGQAARRLANDELLRRRIIEGGLQTAASLHWRALGPTIDALVRERPMA